MKKKTKDSTKRFKHKLKIKDGKVFLPEEEAKKDVEGGLLVKIFCIQKINSLLISSDIIKGQLEYKLPSGYGLPDYKIAKAVLSSSKEGKRLIKEFGPKYKLRMEFNDEIFKCETNDLKEAIIKLAPATLKTRVKFRIEKDGKICERLYNRTKGRLLFKRDIMLRVFINKLIFK